MTPLHVLVTSDTEDDTPSLHYDTPINNNIASDNNKYSNSYTSPRQPTTPPASDGQGFGKPCISPDSVGESNGSSPSHGSNSSFTAHQKTKLCQLLLEKGADPNIQDRHKR